MDKLTKYTQDKISYNTKVGIFAAGISFAYNQNFLNKNKPNMPSKSKLFVSFCAAFLCYSITKQILKVLENINE
jgi:hypothetical protein